jgi:hypothetical protein
MAVNILLSYAYHSKTDLHEAKRRLRGQGLLMLDSGAYTAYTLGKTISLADYAAFLRDWAGAWDSAVTLDVIGDHEATARNTRKLHDMGLPVLPVFTFGTKQAELDAMAREFSYICVGGTVGYTKQRDHLTGYLTTVRRRTAGQGCSIHTLGVGSLPTITKVRPFTADSSAASGAPTYGSVLVWDGRNLRGVSRKDATRHAELLRRNGIHPALVASGRAWEPARRVSTAAVGFLAVAQADEYLKKVYASPAPESFPVGPHLYSATARTHHTEWSSIDMAAEHLTTPRSGPHLYSATNGDRNSHDWSAVYGAAEQFAAGRGRPGPHLYSAVSAARTWSEDAIERAVVSAAGEGGDP